MKSDHVAEIARLIGLVSAESQSVHGGGEDGPSALGELKDYLLRWPEALSTLEDQVREGGMSNSPALVEHCLKKNGQYPRPLTIAFTQYGSFRANGDRLFPPSQGGAMLSVDGVLNTTLPG